MDNSLGSGAWTHLIVGQACVALSVAYLKGFECGVIAWGVVSVLAGLILLARKA